jgi:hypothetical protein
MASQENEKAMDGLLRQCLAREEVTKGECPSPELLAAYYEQTLRADDTSAYELHFSQCARCREQLALIAREEAEVELDPTQEPVLVSARAMTNRAVAPASATIPTQSQVRPGVERRPRRALFDLRWLVPVAAVVILIVFIYPRLLLRHAEIASNREIATSNQPPTPQAQPGYYDVAPTAPATPSASPSLKKASRPPSASSPSTATPPSTGSMQTLNNETSTARGGAFSNSAGRTASKSGTGGSARAPVSRLVEGQAAGAAVGRVPERKELATEPAPAAPPPELDESLEKNVIATSAADAVASPAPPPPAEAHQTSESVELGRRNFSASSPSKSLAKVKPARERSPDNVIRTPDSNVLYRIASGGFIERSEDAGVSWQGQLLNASSEFAAGSAPAPKICWLVGRAGIIFLTNDGKNWRKIPAPSDSDFSSVSAKDAHSATVTTATGQRWSTDDAGETWNFAK